MPNAPATPRAGTTCQAVAGERRYRLRLFRRGDRGHRIFAAATAVGLAHALDDAVLNRQAGVPATQHLAALFVVTAIAVPAILLFSRMRTGVRAIVALAIGTATLTNGALHGIHIVVDRVSGSDVTGVLAAMAGATLVLMAHASLLAPWRARSPVGASLGDARSGQRDARVLVPSGLLPVAVGIGQTHLFRDPIGEPPCEAYETVAFDATEGLKLSGWYTPSRSGAGVIVVNSAGVDRLGSVRHARMLAEHGYGVLLYDARGAGQSEGSPNGCGWEHDVLGAIEFLQARSELDPRRIGGLGLSTGADVLIDVSAEDKRVRPVVADGATMRSYADIPPADRLANAYMLRSWRPSDCCLEARPDRASRRSSQRSHPPPPAGRRGLDPR